MIGGSESLMFLPFVMSITLSTLDPVSLSFLMDVLKLSCGNEKSSCS
ncbi:hypothetical protein L5F32_06690 [Aliarcobacter butzleri]|nr:hypothetical protein [Aliarcobacter butzleri]MCG3651956.1 hypothetical protein [Aliarcobacter butzleri]